jgi:oleate hydratase
MPMMEQKRNDETFQNPKTPKETNAYLVGGGIASLAAAVYLIRDGNVPASQIHILESSPFAGGSMDGAGNAQDGYVLRGGRMLNFSYVCLYDLLATVPSLADSSKSVMQEIDEFNAISENKTHAKARLVAKGVSGPEIVDVRQMGLTAMDRHHLVHMAMEAEHRLGTKRINECFEESFFQTKFWFMWATM